MNKTESHWKQEDKVGNYSLDQGGYSGSGDKQSGSGCILKTEPKGLPNGQMCGTVKGSHAHPGRLLHGGKRVCRRPGTFPHMEIRSPHSFGWAYCLVWEYLSLFRA